MTMFEHRRCYHDEFADMLIAFQEYNIKTRAIAKAKINPREFNRLLNALVVSQLVQVKGKKYSMTETGGQYLSRYVELQEML